MFEAEPESEKKPRVGRCVLEERLAEVVVATDLAAIDMRRFYTINELCEMLQCDERTLKRRRDTGQPPWFISLGGLLRCPAFLFWEWVASEIKQQLMRRETPPQTGAERHQAQGAPAHPSPVGKVPATSTEPTKQA